MNSQRRYPSSKCARAYRSMTPGGPRGCAERRSGPDRGCWRRARTQPRRRRRGGRLCRFLLSTPTAFSDAPPADLSPQTRRWREMDSNFQSPKGRPDKQRRQSSTLFVREPSFGVRPTRCRKSRFGPSVSGAKGGFRALRSHAMSGSYQLSAPLSPLQETNGRHGSQARNVSPV